MLIILYLTDITHIYISIYIYVYMYVCMYIHIYVYIHMVLGCVCAYHLVRLHKLYTHAYLHIYIYVLMYAYPMHDVHTTCMAHVISICCARVRVLLLLKRLPLVVLAASSYVADASARTTCSDWRSADDDWLPSLGRDGARFARSPSGMRRPNVQTSGPVESDRCSYVKHSTVLLIPTPQRVLGRRTENSRVCSLLSLCGGSCAALSRLVVERLVDCLNETTRAGRAS